jgi:hypothetical protein
MPAAAATSRSVALVRDGLLVSGSFKLIASSNQFSLAASLNRFKAEQPLCLPIGMRDRDKGRLWAGWGAACLFGTTAIDAP